MNITNNENMGDEFFRYKRPDLILNYEGHGKNTKTIILNLIELADSLSRQPNEIMKYFSYEFGTQTKQNTLKGMFNKTDLNNTLHEYIQEYILCSVCSLPSTTYKIKKSKIKIICSACGNIMSKLPSEHKLVNFIQKNKVSKKITM